MLLPDVNVWLAVTFDSHSHHPAAKTWFDGLSGQVCYFCRMTQQGFLRNQRKPATQNQPTNKTAEMRDHITVRIQSEEHEEHESA